MKTTTLQKLEALERRFAEIKAARLEPDRLSASLMSVTAEELRKLAAELDAEVSGNE